MGLSKIQVKEHILNVEKYLQNEHERKLQGYEFAKLCYQVKDYENAIRYLGSYLTVQERNHRAQKWMGRLYEATSDKVKALIHYERSLELKNDQRDVVFKVAELYLSLDKPPIESLKKCKSAIERISSDHPFSFTLTERIQHLEGKSPGKSIIKQLMGKKLHENFQDHNYWIKLVNQYSKSGKLKEASECCSFINQKRLCVDSYPWQQCSLHIAELFHESLYVQGSTDSYVLMDSYVAVLKGICIMFNLCINRNMNDSYELSCLILKFDQLLFKACGVLRSIPASAAARSVYHMAIRELSGQLFLMAAQYLCFEGNLLKSDTLLNRLGDLCLLVSLKATPPNATLSFGSLSASSKLQLEEWQTIACTRLSIVGWQLVVKCSLHGRSYLTSVIEEVNSKNDALILIKSVFGKVSDKQVSCGSGSIQYNIQQSFLAADDSLLKIQPDIPVVEDLMVCDKEYVVSCKSDLHKLFWLCFVYDALEKVVPISEWLETMFPHLMLESPDLLKVDAESLSRFDLEAYLIAQYYDFKKKLLMSPSTKEKFLGSVMNLFPRCKLHFDKAPALWKKVTMFLGSTSSMQEKISLKRTIQDFLCSVRALSTNVLDIDQLVFLARHFKKEAERVDAGDSVHGVIKTRLQRSSHYWNIVVSIIGDKHKFSSPSSKTLRSWKKALPLSAMNQDSVLAEAQFALGSAALYCNDATLALGHFSKVDSPQAAWNQVQIYMLLADQDLDLCTQLSYVEKALALVRVFKMSYPSEHLELEEKLQNKQEEIHQLLEESSQDLCVKEQEPVPQLFSTPTKGNFPLSPELSINEDVKEALRKKDQQIADISQQLQLMQVEMKVLKKNYASLHDESQSARDISSLSASLDNTPLHDESQSARGIAPFGTTPLHDESQSARDISSLSASLDNTPLHDESQSARGIAPFGTTPLHDESQSARDISSLSASFGTTPLHDESQSARDISSLSASLDTTPSSLDVPDGNDSNSYSLAEASSAVTTAQSGLLSLGISNMPASVGSLLSTSSSGVTMPTTNFSFQPPTGLEVFQFGPSTTSVGSSGSSMPSTLSHPATIGSGLFQTTPVIGAGPFKFGSTMSSGTIFSSSTGTGLIKFEPGTLSHFPLKSSTATSTSLPLTIGSTMPSNFQPNSSVGGSGVTVPTTNLFSTTTLGFPTSVGSSGFTVPTTNLFSTTTPGFPTSVGSSGFTVPTTNLFSTTTPGFPTSVGGSGVTIPTTNLFSTTTPGFPTSVGSSGFTVPTTNLFSTTTPGFPTSVGGSGFTIPTTNLFSTTTPGFHSGPTSVGSSGVTVSTTNLFSTTTPGFHTSVGGSGFTIPTTNLFSTTTPGFHSGPTSVGSSGVTVSTTNLFSTTTPGFHTSVGGSGVTIPTTNLFSTTTPGFHTSVGSSGVTVPTTNLFSTTTPGFPTSVGGSGVTIPTTNLFSTTTPGFPTSVGGSGVTIPTTNLFSTTTPGFHSGPTSVGSSGVTVSTTNLFSTTTPGFHTSVDGSGVTIPTTNLFSTTTPGFPTSVGGSGVTIPTTNLFSTTTPGFPTSVGGSGVTIPTTNLFSTTTPGFHTSVGGSGVTIPTTNLFSTTTPGFHTSVGGSGVTIPTTNLFSTTTPGFHTSVGGSGVTIPTTNLFSTTTPGFHTSVGGSGVTIPTTNLFSTTTPGFHSGPTSVGGSGFTIPTTNLFSTTTSTSLFTPIFPPSSLPATEGKLSSFPSLVSSTGMSMSTSSILASSTASSGLFTPLAASPSLETSIHSHKDPDKKDLSGSPLLLAAPSGIKSKSPAVESPVGIESESPAGIESESPAGVKSESPLPSAVPVGVRSSSIEGFSSSLGMLSFSDIISQSATDTSSFAKTQDFSFRGAGTQLFASNETTEGSDNPEEEVDIDFKPIVTLPESFLCKSWDDDADILFEHRSKLFRFDTGTGQWKERGVGDIKIMKHKQTGKVRVIMRRDQILKICCNHYITKDMKLVQGNNEKSWIWHTQCDLSGDESKQEKFAVRFKFVESAREFNKVFNDCVQDLKQDVDRGISEIKDSVSLSVISNKAGSWECHVCMVINALQHEICAACKAPRPMMEENHSKPDASSPNGEETRPIKLSECSTSKPLRFPLTSSSSPHPPLQFPLNPAQEYLTTPKFPLLLEQDRSGGPQASEPEQDSAEVDVSPQTPEPEQDSAEVDVSPQTPEPEQDSAEVDVSPQTPEPEQDSAEVDVSPQTPEPEQDSDEVDVSPQTPEPEQDSAEVDVSPQTPEPEQDSAEVDVSPQTPEPEQDSDEVDVSPQTPEPEQDSAEVDVSPQTPEPEQDSAEVDVSPQTPEPEQDSAEVDVSPQTPEPEQDSAEVDVSPQTPEPEQDSAEVDVSPQAPEPEQDSAEVDVSPQAPEPEQDSAEADVSPQTPEPEQDSAEVDVSPQTPEPEQDSDEVDVSPQTPEPEQDSAEVDVSPQTPEPEQDSDEVDVSPQTPEPEQDSDEVDVSPQTPEPEQDSAEVDVPPEPEQDSAKVVNDVSDDGRLDEDEDSVIFLYEELPAQELIVKAEQFMLPRSFYLYEKKAPCPGCRGCSDTFDVENVTPVADTISPAGSHPPSPLAHEGFSSLGMLSFSDIISQSATDTSSFAKTQDFSFRGAGTQLFASNETTEGSDNPEEEVDIDFKPIVTLPESFLCKSWDDDADILFEHRSKLFRFDTGTGQWKERGVGDIKIMKHKQTGKERVIMRRDQILKICCNHYITKDMKLMPGNNEKSWIWLTHCDLSGDESKQEKFAVRFKRAETADKFKRVFDSCGNNVEQVISSVPAYSDLKATDSWECSVCMVMNPVEDDICVACRTPKVH